MKSKLRHLAVIMAVILCIPALMPATVQKAEAGSKYYLPAKATTYFYTKGKWKKDYTLTLKYNKKGYALRYVYSDGEKRSFKYTYYNNGNVKKIKFPGGESYTFDNSGRVKKYLLKNGKAFETYKYSGSRLTRFYDGGTWYKLNYSYHPNRKIARIESKPADWTLDEDPEYWSEFDENRLLKSEFQDGFPNAFNYRYKYDKKGRVTTVARYDGKKKSMKVVFNYSKASTTGRQIRYLTIINNAAGMLNGGMRAAFCDGKIGA